MTKAMACAKTKTVKKRPDHEYHVVWDRNRSRYHVVRNDGVSFGFSSHRGGAIGMAMSAAIKDSELGVRTSVLVQQKGGGFHLEWASE
jgi:hypothetical protein